MGDDMSATLAGLIAVAIYAIGVRIGLWIGRGHYRQDNNNLTGGYSPKPILGVRPSPPGKE